MLPVILGQSNPAVGLFIAGISRRLLERAVLSTIELKHFSGKYRFVYVTSGTGPRAVGTERGRWSKW